MSLPDIIHIGPWRIVISPWQDGYGWKVDNTQTGYTYNSVMYDSALGAQISALRHLVLYQVEHS